MRDLVINGGCHCGALSYALTWPGSYEADSPVTIPGRRCSCSFCTRLDGVWTSHPDASLDIQEDPDHPATVYRFGTGTANFLFCRRCGITPLVTCEIDGQTYSVVNVNTFDDQAKSRVELDLTDTCFDGESTPDRLGRRQVRWVRNVRWKRR